MFNFWKGKKENKKDYDKEGTHFDLPINQEIIGLEGAVLFNSLNKTDQRSVLHVYQIRLTQRELDLTGVEGIEETARLYQAQKCAFEDVLAKEGFESAESIVKDYQGRIAFLTYHGTLAVLGKLKDKGRHITMNRIHSLKWQWDHRRGFLMEDLAVNKAPRIYIINYSNYQGSYLRALAFNPRGADGNELESHESIVSGIGLETALYLMQPREKVKVGAEDGDDEPFRS